MKNNLILSLLAGLILMVTACQKESDIDYMLSVPDGIHLLSHVNTYYYDGRDLTDTFSYNSSYEITGIQRREGELVSQFYFKDRKLKESKVQLHNGEHVVSYNINYMSDGRLSVSNDTEAFILSDNESGYYTQLTYYSREPFEEWDESYVCEFNWELGNLKSSCVDRNVVYYHYDDKPNPLAGYISWGFFHDELYIGTTNNRMGDDYQYTYNSKGYPETLITPKFYREFFYH